MKNRIPGFLSLCAAVVLSSCTFSVTKPNEPVFTKDIQTISKQIDSVEAFSTVNIDGSQKKTGDKVLNTMLVKLHGVRDLPASQADQFAIAQRIFEIARSSLKDTTQFDVYKISFNTNASETAFIEFAIDGGK